MPTRRAFVVVLDACGVGALPDAQRYGDAGTDTLGHLAEAVGGLSLPNLEGLGLGNAHRLRGVGPVAAPVMHGRLAAQGPGKDSTCGHWELMGVVAADAPPVFPGGFPDEVVRTLAHATGRVVLGNTACNGVEAIERFGMAAWDAGGLVLYTSQDSVLQIAAHTERVPEGELYAACRTARELMYGPLAVSRVIARPFTGPPGDFRRTLGRRDFALRPPTRSHLEELQGAGVAVHAVGKVNELFAGVGVDHDHHAPTNALAIAHVDRLLDELTEGLVFANLVETDQVYGHRKDLAGFHDALRRIDDAVAGWVETMGEEDLLVLTADHGCDPLAPGTDHTREHVPLLARFAGHGSRRHDGVLADVGASALEWLTGRSAALPGRSFLASG